jgi:hypothetical protein
VWRLPTLYVYSLDTEKRREEKRREEKRREEKRSRDSVVGMATGYGLDDQGVGV